MARSANSFLDQSFLSGLFDLAEALKDPERSAARVAGRVASGAVPFTGAVRTAQQATDPVVRRPQSVTETIKAGIPGLSESVEPRIDRFGQVVTREGGPLRRAADPFNTASVKEDPIAAELQRLGVSLTLPSDRVNLPEGRTLTRGQETEVQQRRGRAVRAMLEGVIGSRQYRRLSDERKIAVVEEAIRRARSRESLRLRRELTRP